MEGEVTEEVEEHGGPGAAMRCERVDILSLGCLPQIVQNMCAWFGIMDHDLGPK
jgi:hypothetical protein